MITSFTLLNKPYKKIFAVAGAVIFWLLLWQLVAFYIDDAFFLPGPAATLRELLSALAETEVRRALLMSVARVITGYAYGAAAGILLAVITSRVVALKVLFEPLLSVIRATPVVSFIILAFLLLDRETVPSYIVFLMVMPMIWAGLSEGLSGVDYSLIEMSDMYGLSFVGKLRHLYIPAVMPYFTAAAVTAFGFAWKSGVAAEVICYPENSVGKLIYRARTQLDSTKVFAYTAAVILISIALELVLRLLLKRFRGRNYGGGVITK